jgi:hypothetical protein
MAKRPQDVVKSNYVHCDKLSATSGRLQSQVANFFGEADCKNCATMLLLTPLQSPSSCGRAPQCGIGYINPRHHASRVYTAAVIGDPIRGASTGVPLLLRVSQDDAVAPCGVGEFSVRGRMLRSGRYLQEPNALISSQLFQDEFTK